MTITDSAKCEKCPFYRPKRLLRREKCEFPGVPIPDTCPRLESGARVLSWDEAMAAEIVWLEWRQSGEIVMMMPSNIGGVACGVTPGTTYLLEEVAPRKRDGVLFRFWDRRPTDEQREMMGWDN